VAVLADADALKQALAIVLLAPAVPMLFMGEEWAATSPFLFFCDFGPDLAAAVTRGRRAEFGRFARFRDPAVQAAIPDPNDERTFRASKLDWAQRDAPAHAAWRTFTAGLLATRAARLVPHLGGPARGGRYRVDGQLLQVDWTLADGARLHLAANFGPPTTRTLPPGMPLHLQRATPDAPGATRLDSHGVAVTLEEPA
jgi:maltooligosyltrehalose trehalohydrolase